VLAVPAFLYVGWKHARGRSADPKLAYPLAWFLLSAALSADQFPRYGHHLVLPMGILIGIGLADLQEYAAGTFTNAPSNARRGMAVALFVLAMAIPALLLLRPVSGWRVSRDQNGFPDFPLVNDAFQWLRHETPDPGGVTDPRERPAYGVLAPWHDGPWLTYIAERPNIASQFILSRSEVTGIRRSVEILLAEDEARAASAAERLRARYVVATNLNPQLQTYCLFLGRPADDLMGITVSKGEGAFHFHERYFRILNNRMLLADGSELKRPQVPALARFRLVYESPFTFDWNNVPQDPAVPLPGARIAGYKIFEQVRGARIEGRGLPLGRIRAEATIHTNQGRSFVYTQSARCDEEGRFALVLPYATEAVRAHQTAAISRYRISGDGPHAELSVTEDQVRSGARIEVGDPGTARSPAAGTGDEGATSGRSKRRRPVCAQASVGPPAPDRSDDVHVRSQGAGGGGCEPYVPGRLYRNPNARRSDPPGVEAPSREPIRSCRPPLRGGPPVSSPAAFCPSSRAHAARA